MTRHQLVPLVLVGVAALSAAAGGQGRRAPAPGPTARALPTGVRIEDVRVGRGPVVEWTSHVRILYTAWAAGRVFDERQDANRPYEVPLGEKRLIVGLEQGIVGMQTGGRRRIFVPPDLAWGDKGLPPRVPPGASVVYEVLLLGVTPHKGHPREDEGQATVPAWN